MTIMFRQIPGPVGTKFGRCTRKSAPSTESLQTGSFESRLPRTGLICSLRECFFQMSLAIGKPAKV